MNLQLKKMMFSENFIKILIILSLIIIAFSVLILIVLLINDYRKKQIW